MVKKKVTKHDPEKTLLTVKRDVARLIGQMAALTTRVQDLEILIESYELIPAPGSEVELETELVAAETTIIDVERTDRK